MSTTTTAVTADQIIAEVRRLAAEKPDFVYEKPEFSPYCLYMHGDEPGCIFGHALHNLGWNMKGYLAGSIATVLIGNGVDPHVSTTARQLDWMTEVQRKQDSAYSWEKAVANADREFPLG